MMKGLLDYLTSSAPDAKVLVLSVNVVCCTEVMYQARKNVFENISKHREESWKYEAERSISDDLQGVWKCVQIVVKQNEAP